MQIPQTAEYALRAMAYLANSPRGEAVAAKELARRAGIPNPYLSKILRKLVVHRLLLAKKGHGGGFALAMPPRAIRFLDVLRALDLSPSPDRCAFGWGGCDPERPCPLHGPWNEMNESFWVWATTTTLADVGSLEFADLRLANLSGP